MGGIEPPSSKSAQKPSPITVISDEIFYDKEITKSHKKYIFS